MEDIKKKIVIIGGGSPTWTPSMLVDILRLRDKFKSHIVLVDVNEKQAEIMAKLGRRMIEQANASTTLQTTTNRKNALLDADFVITCFDVGGGERRRNDVEIAAEHGIYNEGNTVGSSSIFHALRQIPVITEICKEIRKLCPDAWLINCSNPMSCLCMTAHCNGVEKIAGWCSGIYAAKAILSDFLGVKEDKLEIVAGGLNHFTWITKIKVNGKNVYPELKDKMWKMKFLKWKDWGTWAIAPELYRIHGLFPSGGDDYVADFYPFFSDTKKYGLESLKTHFDKLNRSYKKRVDKCLRQASGKEAIEPELTTAKVEKLRGPVKIIGALSNKMAVKTNEFCNIRNKGFVDNISSNAIVEVPVMIDSSGISGINIGQLPTGIIATMQSAVYQQELTVKAGMTGNYQLVLQALLLDPQIDSIDNAKRLLKKLFKQNEKYLPNFERKDVK